MSKEEAVVFLRNNGYSAETINGIVYIESTNESDFKRASKILKKAGYENSFGWKQESKNEQEYRVGNTQN